MKKGISLVALVITIIVLIILTATVMIMFSDGGILGKSEEAVLKSDFSNILDSFMLKKNELMLEQLSNANIEKATDENEIKGYIPLLQNNNRLINGHKYTDLIQIYDNKIYQSDMIKKPDNDKDKEISKWLSEIGIDILHIPISEGNYVGYYADIDADGIVDGIIYADLLYGVTGIWGNALGSFSYSSISNSGVKKYYISQENYEGDFGQSDVISPIGSGIDRFYVMGLSDVSNSNYNWFYWYKNAYYEEEVYNEEDGQYYYSHGRMTDYATTTSKDFGTGKTNTMNMINKWNNEDYGEQSEYDIWGSTDPQLSNGWFVPSKEELAAFACNLDITSSNYSSKGLKNNYWSSSQFDIMRAWAFLFSGEMANANVVIDGRAVRLTTTF